MIKAHQLPVFFGVAFGVSGLAFALTISLAVTGSSASSWVPLALFPLLVGSVAASGVVLTLVSDGRDGLRRLRASLDPRRAVSPWILAVAVPPLAITLVLVVLGSTSAAFTPGLFLIGFAFGIPAGVLEELGWTGFAFPRLRARLGTGAATAVLGAAWALWHLPVVDALGAASPHGAWLPMFFAAFALVLMALRALIVSVYLRTGSLLLAQLLHASSTSFLAVLSPTGVSAREEATWYLLYALVLWSIVVAINLRARMVTRAQVA